MNDDIRASREVSETVRCVGRCFVFGGRNAYLTLSFGFFFLFWSIMSVDGLYFSSVWLMVDAASISDTG